MELDILRKKLNTRDDQFLLSVAQAESSSMNYLVLLFSKDRAPQLATECNRKRHGEEEKNKDALEEIPSIYFHP